MLLRYNCFPIGWIGLNRGNEGVKAEKRRELCYLSIDLAFFKYPTPEGSNCSSCQESLSGHGGVVRWGVLEGLGAGAAGLVGKEGKEERNVATSLGRSHRSVGRRAVGWAALNKRFRTVCSATSHSGHSPSQTKLPTSSQSSREWPCLLWPR